MQGLYRRALEIRESQQHLRLLSPEEALEDDAGISPQERAQIREQIEQEVAGTRISLDPRAFEKAARRGGGGLPFLVNVLAIALIATGVWLLLRFFDSQEQTLVTERTTLESAEGRLLARLQEESQQEIDAKDAEIDSITTRLAELSTERDQLRDQTEQQIATREAELAAEFQAALEAERERLLEGGLTAAEVDAQLAEFEAQQRALYEQEIDQVRAAAEAELAAQEQALTSLTQEYQASLAEAQSERQELEASFAEQAATLEGERTAALDRLASLQQLQEQEAAAMGQLIAAYRRVQTALDAGDFAAAQSELGTVREFLSQPSIAALPTIDRRRQVELFLTDSLERLVELELNQTSIDTESLVSTAAMLTTVAELVAQADGAYEEERYEEAQQIYLSALGRVPAVQVGLERLDSIRQQFEQAESDRVARFVTEGNQRYLAGEYEAAADAYGRAIATLPTADDEMLSRVVDAGIRVSGDIARLEAQARQLSEAEAEVATLRTQVAELQGQLESLTTELASAREDAREQAQAETAAELQATRAALDQAQSSLAEAQSQLAANQARLSETEAELAEARSALEANRAELQAAQRQLASLSSTVTSLRSDLADADALAARQNATISGLLQARQEQRALAEAVASFGERYGDGSAAGQTPSTLELLETKLVILRVVSSDVVRDEYPELTELLGQYLDQLAARSSVDAVAVTLSGINALLGELNGEAADEESVAAVAATDPEAFDIFLTRLQLLLDPDA